MIYTASYFAPKNWHGRLIPISRSIPAALVDRVEADHPLRWLLAPSQDLLRWWKRQETYYGEMGWEFPAEQAIDQYTDRYRQELRQEFEIGDGRRMTAVAELRDYLQKADPSHDETWLCWEPAGEFCHRNLDFKFVVKFRPDCAGGMDQPKQDELKPKKPTQEDGLNGQGDRNIIQSDSKPPVAGKQPENESLEIGDVVRLKLMPSRIYRVLSAQIGTGIVVDTGKPWYWHYELEPVGGGARAYWSRSQLEKIEYSFSSGFYQTFGIGDAN